MIHQFYNTPIYYTRKGQGPAFVFLHGFLESSTMWHNITPHYIKTHTVIAIDLPGFGKSKTVSAVHTMELMAQLTAEILKVEAIEVATIIGHSMGGYVALALAEADPQLVKNLVLLNSTPYNDSAERKENRNRALAIIDTNKNAFISMAISNLFTEKERSLFKQEIIKLKDEALQLSSKGVKAAITGMRDRENRLKVLKNFSGTKVLISGVDDALIAINDAIKVSEATKTTLYKIESGHMSWLTNISEIVKIMHFIE